MKKLTDVRLSKLNELKNEKGLDSIVSLLEVNEFELYLNNISEAIEFQKNKNVTNVEIIEMLENLKSEVESLINNDENFVIDSSEMVNRSGEITGKSFVINCLDGVIRKVYIQNNGYTYYYNIKDGEITGRSFTLNLKNQKWIDQEMLNNLKKLI